MKLPAPGEADNAGRAAQCGVKWRFIMKTVFIIKDYEGRRGSTLMTVMCLSIVLLFASMVMAYMTNQSIARSRRINNGAQTLAIAEAGIADMVARLSTNYNQWSDATNTSTFGGGSFTAVSATQSNGNVVITSSGTLDGITRTTVMELLGTYQDLNDDLFSLDGAILSGGNVTFDSAAFTINGNVHANGDIISSGGAKNGDFTNTAVITANGTIGDLDATLQPGSPTRTLPTFDFDSFRELAITNGIYYSNTVTLANWNGTPSNGIVYVNGNVTVKNHSSLCGTLVANGDITVINQFNHTAFQGTTNMPALLSTGNIDLDNRETYNGVIYADGNVIIRNNMTCHGGIISGGYTDIKNKVTMNQPNGYPPWDPLNPSVPPEVIVGGWLK